MRPPSQIIRGETVVHSLIDKESLQMRPPSQIIRGETVVHSLIDKESLSDDKESLQIHHHKLYEGKLSYTL